MQVLERGVIDYDIKMFSEITPMLHGKNNRKPLPGNSGETLTMADSFNEVCNRNKEISPRLGITIGPAITTIYLENKFSIEIEKVQFWGWY